MGDLQAPSIQLHNLDHGISQKTLENGVADSAPPFQGTRDASDDALAGNVTEAKQRWNHPRKNMWKVFASFVCFVVVGANDGSYGVRPSSAPGRACIFVELTSSS